jgi:glycosyl transferase family 87
VPVLATTETRTKAIQTPYYVKGLALGLPAYLIGIHLWTWVFTISTFLGGRSDFRQLYTAGYMVRSGHAHELYDYDAQKYFQNKLVSQADMALPFVRPAYEALLFVPFSFLSYRSAYLAFLGLNVILLAVCYKLLRPKLENLARIYRWLPAALFLAYLPIAAALIQGQDSIVLLTLFTLALSSLEPGNAFRAGAILGLAAFKFQIAIPIVLLFLVWRRWRFAAAAAITAILLALGSVWLVGLIHARIYTQSLLVFGSPSHTPGQLWYPLPPNLMPNLRGLIFGIADEHFPTAWITGITGVLSLLIVLLVATFRPKTERAQGEFLVAMLTSVLVSYYLLIHDLSILLIPIAITLSRFIDSEATGDQQGRLLTRAATLMFVAPICESYIPEQFFVVAVPLMIFLYVLAKSWDRNILNAALDIPSSRGATVQP